MVKGKITKANSPAVRLGATSSGLISIIPHFYAGCPFCRNPPNLFWLGTGTKYSGLHTQNVWSNYAISNSSLISYKGLLSVSHSVCRSNFSHFNVAFNKVFSVVCCRTTNMTKLRWRESSAQRINVSSVQTTSSANAWLVEIAKRANRR